MSTPSGAALKYVEFRNRYAFVRVESDRPLGASASVDAACAICLGSRYPLFATRYRVRQNSLAAGAPLRGTPVTLPSCAKCLKYIWHKNMVNYVNERRRDQYRRRFADLVDFTTQAHAAECAQLPTLRAFVELVNAGKPFRPGLVLHVSELVYQLRVDGGARLRFLARCASAAAADDDEETRRTTAHLRFRIDACSPPLTDAEREAVESFAGGTGSVGKNEK